MKTLVALAILLLSSTHIKAQTFQKNGYHDLVVSIHPDVQPSDENQRIMVEKIKKWIGEGSKKLFYATEQFAYIASVNILLPKTWTGVEANSSSGLSYEDGVVRVDKANPLYGDAPYTLQPGGCGDKGEFIHVTPDYVMEMDASSTQYFGPPEKLFVHEWSKLRYGVFEEYGYPGDKVFPLFYYEQSYTGGEVVNTLTPNFCTNEPVKGVQVDLNDGGACKYDSQTNLPDGNCIFVPQGDNSKIQSSYMALPFLSNLGHFCNKSEAGYTHFSRRPNKHNAMCDRKPTWSVISENKDFQEPEFEGPLQVEVPPETTFNVLRPQEERFVFVLDVSGSMVLDQDYPTRLDRLKQSSERWVKYEVREGSSVGVTSFSDKVTVVKDLTLIDGEAVREDIAMAISNLKGKGGTCLGDGLLKGMDVLNGADDKSTGGVILFVTDGKFECTGGTNINDPKLIDRVKKTKVRIITIAFGTSTDPNLENLAVISDGKVFFVPDGTGIEDINNALEGSLTFQPALPSGEVDIVVYSKIFKNVPAAMEDSFRIDNTLGRSVKFQMDFISNGQTAITDVTFELENGTTLGFPVTESAKSPFIAKFDHLEAGLIKFKISVKDTVPYMNIVISSKSATDETLPFFTRCWVSSGNSEVDMSNQKLSILAQVSQGNRPVLNAKVVAYVERGDEELPLTLDLFDTGSGADIISNDGVYSRYFVVYDGKNGDYTLRCQVEGDADTNFVTQSAGAKFLNKLRSKFDRAYPQESDPNSPICCGSGIDIDKVNTAPTGNFSRAVTGTSFKLTNVPSKDIFPPSKILNLRAEILDTEIEISFTAPGDNLDEGKAHTYDLRYSESLDDISNETLWFELSNITESDVTAGNFTPAEAGAEVRFRISNNFQDGRLYFMAMKASDKFENVSPISNIFRLVTIAAPPPPEVDDGLTGGAIAGIVIGTLLGVLVVVAGAYFFVKKRNS